jgi:hypothetical protein
VKLIWTISSARAYSRIYKILCHRKTVDLFYTTIERELEIGWRPIDIYIIHTLYSYISTLACLTTCRALSFSLVVQSVYIRWMNIPEKHIAGQKWKCSGDGTGLSLSAKNIIRSFVDDDVWILYLCVENFHSDRIPSPGKSQFLIPTPFFPLARFNKWLKSIIAGPHQNDGWPRWREWPTGATKEEEQLNGKKKSKSTSK